jgi:hypothetical protein
MQSFGLFLAQCARKCDPYCMMEYNAHTTVSFDSTIYYHYYHQVLDTCLRLGSKDNMTALVVKFKAQAIGSGEGVLGRRKEREDKGNDGSDEEAAGQQPL